MGAVFFFYIFQNSILTFTVQTSADFPKGIAKTEDFPSEAWFSIKNKTDFVFDFHRRDSS